MKKRIIALALVITTIFSTPAKASTVIAPQVNLTELRYVMDEVGVYFPLLMVAIMGLQLTVSIYDCVKENEDIVQTPQSKLPRKYEPNSVVEQISKKENNEVLGRRYYDEDGYVEMDIHTTDHGNPKQHSFKNHTHKHLWHKEEGSALPVRDEEPQELTDEEYFRYVMIPRGMVNKEVLDEISFDLEKEYLKEIE